MKGNCERGARSDAPEEAGRSRNRRPGRYARNVQRKRWREGKLDLTKTELLKAIHALNDESGSDSDR